MRTHTHTRRSHSSRVIVACEHTNHNRRIGNCLAFAIAIDSFSDTHTNTSQRSMKMYEWKHLNRCACIYEPKLPVSVHFTLSIIALNDHKFRKCVYVMCDVRACNSEMDWMGERETARNKNEEKKYDALRTFVPQSNTTGKTAATTARHCAMD